MKTTEKFDGLFWRIAPPVAAVLLVVLFVLLGFWQLDRAREKVVAREQFDGGDVYTPIDDARQVADFQRISASGHFITDKQFLIDNIISNSRIGYYVVAPFEYAPDKPILMVNRGWIAAGRDRGDLPPVDVSDETFEIRGLAGRLPRVGIRSGEVFPDSRSWPMLANYPELSHLSQAIGRDVLPFVLLQDADDSQALERQWQPKEQGPMMHYGYAFQWFAMAAAVLGIFVWQMRKRRNEPSV